MLGLGFGLGLESTPNPNPNPNRNPNPNQGSGRAPAELLLVNPFEEGCFHEDLKAGVRHDYHSCGQFNNVLASLLHALALSRLLCRTLLLPG